MKRELKASTPIEIRTKAPTKSHERELADVMEYMVAQIGKRFKNQAIMGLQAGTVDKFADTVQLIQKKTHTHYREVKRHRFIDSLGNELCEDAIRRSSDYDEDLEYTAEEYTTKQPYYTHSFAMADCSISRIIKSHQFKDAQSGNYAKVFLSLAGRVQRQIVKQFDDDRIEAMVNGILDKVDRRGRDDFYSAIEGALGISSKELALTEGMKATTNALKLETAQWVKKLRDETLELYTSNTLRAMTLGNGLDGILDEFEGLEEKRKNHAKFTARNQINNYNSISTKIRAQNLGITQGVWVASMDERTRPSHAERDGKTFDLDKGLYSSIDGKYLLTGTDYQCFPAWSKVNYSSACNKLFRRRYTGKLLSFVFDDGVVLSTTPNHPIMTTNGFKPANLINKGDNIIRAIDKAPDLVKAYGYDIIPTMEQVFAALSFLDVVHKVPAGISGEFHGDISDGEIEVITADSFLMREVDSSIVKKLNELNFTKSDKMIILSLLTCNSNFASSLEASSASSSCVMRCLDLVSPLLVSHFSPLERFRFALGSWGDSCFSDPVSDNVSGNSKVFSDCVFAFAIAVHGADLFVRHISLCRLGVISYGWNSKLLKLGTEKGMTNPDLLSGVFDSEAIRYHVDRVVDKVVADFSGHVYNLETISNDYICQTTAVSNCRCTARFIIPGDDE